MFNRKPFELPKAGYGSKGERGATAASSRAGHTATHRQPDARTQIAADSVDTGERGHDISRTVEPGHCSGARYERAAKNRSGHRAFRQRRRALADERDAR